MKLHIGADTQKDFELECIREFSHSGMQLGTGVSREERRERIRGAIVREGKQDDRWRNTELSYAAAYQRAYHLPLKVREGELAKAPHKPLWGIAPEADAELDDIQYEPTNEPSEEDRFLTA